MLSVLNFVLRLWSGVARERRELVLENVALRHQVDVLTRTRRRPALGLGDRLIWMSLARSWPAWRKHLVIVQPDTVVRRHRAGWWRYWRWRSRPKRRGRPPIHPAIAIEIRRMTEENPRWGHMRVLGQLRKLGFRVSLQTVRRYRKDVPRSQSPGWRTFLENHRREIWASDFSTVHTLWFQTLYVFFFIAHDRRAVMHVNVTAHPTATWVWRQLINATPWGTSPRFLIRDRDRSYGGDFVARARRIGIRTVLTPIATPQANAVAERLVDTFGLDVQAARTVKDWVLRLAHDEGKTVVLTTHQLDMVQELADRVAVIREGRIVADLPKLQLLARFREDRYRITVGAPLDSAVLALPPGASVHEENGVTTLEAPVRDRRDVYVLLDAVRGRDLSLVSVAQVEPDLEEVFVRVLEEAGDGC